MKESQQNPGSDSSATHPNDFQQHESDLLGEFAHVVAEALGISLKAAHFLGKHLPHSLHTAEQVCEISAAIKHDHISSSGLENFICGGLTGATAVGVGVIGMKLAAIFPPLSTPFRELSAAEFAAALAYALSQQKANDGVAGPMSSEVGKRCHAAFDAFKDKTSTNQTKSSESKKQQSGTSQFKSRDYVAGLSRAMPKENTTSQPEAKSASPSDTMNDPLPSFMQEEQFKKESARTEEEKARERAKEQFKEAVKQAAEKERQAAKEAENKQKKAQAEKSAADSAKSHMRDSSAHPFKTQPFVFSTAPVGMTPMARPTSTPVPQATWGRPPAAPGSMTLNPQAHIWGQAKESYLDRLNRFQRAARDAIRDEMCSYRPDFYSAYLRASREVGSGSFMSMCDFRSALSSTNLLFSYNNFHPNAILRDVMSFSRDIGGVAGDVALIEDLLDSEAQANANDDGFIFCINDKDFPFSEELVQQVLQEITHAYVTHDTVPFFSLHFNDNGLLYPVIHPAFQNTLVGEIIGLLDYWMKGYLNGGVFDAEFLTHWHESLNQDETYLRAHLIDLKKYCERECNDVAYVSLREMMNKMGLNDEHANAESPYKQPFQTSFRIISFQDNMQRAGNVLIPSPNFRVEYSIDETPEYTAYIANYRKTHGEVPKNYRQLRQCYESFAQEIKTKLPQLPFCKPFFQLLGLANAFCYFNATLKKMSKMPDLSMLQLKPYRAFPKALPPIPVRYFQTYPMRVTLGEVFNGLLQPSRDASVPSFDVTLGALFNQRLITELPNDLKLRIQQAVEAVIKQKLIPLIGGDSTSIEMNENIVNSMKDQIGFILLHRVNQCEQQILPHLAEYLRVVPTYVEGMIADRPLLEKIRMIPTELARHRDSLKSRWNITPSLVETQIIWTIPSELHNRTRENFVIIKQNIEQMLGFVLREFDSIPGLRTEVRNTFDVAMNRLQERLSSMQENLNIVEANIRSYQDALNQVRALSCHPTKEHLKNQEINRLNEGLREQEAGRNQIRPEIDRINVLINGMPASRVSGTAEVVQGVREEAWRRISELVGELSPAMKDRIKNSILGNVDERQLREVFKQAEVEWIKQAAIQLVNEVHAIQLAALQRLEHSLMTITEKTLENTELSDQFLCEKYTHSVLGFTSKDMAQQTGDSFQVVGGCGVSVPNLTTEQFPNAEAFCEALNVQCHTNTITTIPYGMQSYKAFRIAVKPVCDLTPVYGTHQSDACDSDAELYLVQQAAGGSSDIALTHDHVKTVMDNDGASMLHYASDMLSSDTVALMDNLAPEQYLESDHLGHLPLHTAVKSGNSPVVTYYLNKNKTLANAMTKHGATPLTIAAQFGHVDIIQQLLLAGADPHYSLPNGLYPLYLAISHNHAECALLLLAAMEKNKANLALDSGMTPLHAAIEHKLVDVATALIAKNVPLSGKRKSDGYTAAHCAAIEGYVEGLKALKNANVDLMSPLESGKTALHLAAEAGETATVKYLVAEYPTAVKHKTVAGENALMLAIQAGSLPVALALAEVSSINEVNQTDQTASIMALLRGLPTVSDIMIERGESFSKCDKNQLRYIDYLARMGDFKRLTRLISAHYSEHGNDYYHDYQFANRLSRDGISIKAMASQFGHFNFKPMFEASNPYYTRPSYQFSVSSFLFRSSSKPKYADEKVLNQAVIHDDVGFLRATKLDAITEPNPALLMLAARHGSLRCLSFILKNKKAYQPSIELFFESIQSVTLEAVALILKHAPTLDVNHASDDHYGDTPLHYATRLGACDIVALLLTHGADVKRVNHAGHTPFHLAILLNDHDLLKRLFKLTRPSDWPFTAAFSASWTDELRVFMQKPTINKLLKKYLPRLSIETYELCMRGQSSTVNTDAHQSPSPVSNRELGQLYALLGLRQFTSVLELLERNNAMLRAFSSKEGGKLLQALIQSMDPTLETENSELDRLWSFLKTSGVSIASYRGKDNVLRAVVSGADDEVACYRFSCLSRYYEDELSVLLIDQIEGKATAIQYALAHQLPRLFAEMHATYRVPEHGVPQLYSYHAAVEMNNTDAAKALPEALIDTKNQKQQTPLMLAAIHDNVALIEYFIQHEANVNHVDRYGDNALHHAIKAKSINCALLLAPLSRPIVNREGMTSVMLAAQYGLLPLVRFLCQQSDFRDDINHQGFNALHLAAIVGDEKIITCLVQYGFPVDTVITHPDTKKNKRGMQRTALHFATLKGHIKSVQTLLELGANPEKADSNGNALYEYAVLSGNHEMLKAVQQGDGYFQRARSQSLLIAAVQADNVDALNELILADTNLTHADKQGLSLLHLCALYNAVNSADILLLGGDIALDLRDLAGCSALHYAAQSGHAGMVEKLAAAGASLDLSNSQHVTPMYLAAKSGRLGAVVALLHYGADFTIADEQGVSPAQIALSLGFVTLVVRLVEAGDKSCEREAIQRLPKALRDKMGMYYSKFCEERVPIKPRVIRERNVAVAYSFMEGEEGNNLLSEETLPSVVTNGLHNAQVFIPGTRVTLKAFHDDTYTCEIDRVRKSLDFDTLLRRMTGYMRLKHPSDLGSWKAFCLDVAHCDAAILNKSEKFVVLRVGFDCFHNQYEKREVKQWLQQVVAFKQAFGGFLFQRFLTHNVSIDQMLFKHYLTAIHLMLGVRDNQELIRLMSDRLVEKPYRYGCDFIDFISQLKRMHTYFVTIKSKKRDIDRVIKTFATQTNTLQFPLSMEELSSMKKSYNLIGRYEEEIQQISDEELADYATHYVSQYREGDETAQYRLIAVVIDTVRRRFFAPHDTQILAFLALIEKPELLKGRIAQIQTGEGKSTIIAMLNAYFALNGHFVDVITSANYLAKRDCDKYRSFYKTLKLTTSCVQSSQPTLEDFQGQIIYGTATNFKFAVLQRGLHGESMPKSYRNGVLDERTFDLTIIDEIDTSFIDSAQDASLISRPNPDAKIWVYEPILAFVKAKGEHYTFNKRDVVDLRNHLAQWNQGQYSSEVVALKADALLTWLHSAHTALYIKLENRDYKIRRACDNTVDDLKDADGIEDQITLMSAKDTGEEHAGSAWGEGIHQFMQTKHGLSVTPETLTSASLPHSTYFGFYDHIVGLTGTMGSIADRNLILSIYHVDNCDIPPHFPNKRNMLAPIICENSYSQYERIRLMLEQAKEAGRPALVFFETIETSNAFHEYLVKHDISHQLINTTQKESTEFALARAGMSGMISISTNLAGRGADILLSDESIAVGGLLVILGFYPRTERAERQNFGRAGRQGQPGDGIFILDKTDESIQSLWRQASFPFDRNVVIAALNGLQGEAFIEALSDYRNACVQSEVQSQTLSVEHERVYSNKLQRFFEQVRQVHEVFSDKQFLQQALRLCKTLDGQSMVDFTDKPLFLSKENWQKLITQATIIGSKRGSDWSGFIDQFKETFKFSMMNCWSGFYSTLHQNSHHLSLDQVQAKTEASYALVQEELDGYLSNPENSALNILSQVLQCAIEQSQRCLLGYGRNSDNNLFFGDHNFYRGSVGADEVKESYHV